MLGLFKDEFIMKIINLCNRIIEYSFYAIFFLVPLALAPDTSELFEFNKLWVTFILALVILTAWISKMLIQRQFKIQRTPLDIIILLFLLSQVISTIFSLDRHVSLWGYYSRFNGGLLSIITYIFLYYAFVSNFRENAKTIVKRLIFVALSSGAIVALWGLPSHFGYDPTCLLFRGTFDVSCWTSDFQPKVRIFSTMGQPDWLSAYLSVLLPITIALFIKSTFFRVLGNKKLELSKKSAGFAILYFLMFLLFYVDIAFTKAKSGFLATWFSIAFFAASYAFLELRNRKIKLKNLSLDFKLLLLTLVSIAAVTFFIGTSFARIDSKFSFDALRTRFLTKPAATKTVAKPVATPQPAPIALGELGGTDSGKIRLLVWRGAINAWLQNPIFGTGVETFAFAYYQYRPAEHNLTSEWRYLYNKAHNEYLNYLTTTGAFGLLTYLSMIGFFLFLSLKFLWQNKSEDANNRKVLVLALSSGYISILISNFFGFSVVIINLFLFLIPGLVFILANLINYDKNLSFSFASKKITENKPQEEYNVTTPIWMLIAAVAVINGFFIFTLINFWNADKSYARGYNFDRVNQYQTAYPLLHKAVAERADEPTFKDELSINDAVLAISILQQKTTDKNQQKQAVALAQKLAEEAVATSDKLTSQYPNNVVFWKTRVRIFYTLAQADQRYLPMALTAIKKTAQLAPTDADISYNLGVLYGQNDDPKNAVATLEKTVKLKPDFANAYYALGIFYHQLAINDKGQVVNQEYHQKAIDTMNFMLKNLSPGDSRPIDALKAWQKQ
ncbi:MAG: O-antigen ligase family protein [Patescibacteria group bacterium]|nr:O-antigen ligase family protein [Patescibacteria group bacterium]